jgi:hypothetical protein
MEIDASAEAMLDTRAVRRLVLLELADVAIPPRSAGEPPLLFFRILGQPERLLRVELWDRGELSDARVVSGAQSRGHLLSRRIALAAAELARRLRQRRVVLYKQRERELLAQKQRRAAEARRTLEGPLALRAAAGVLLLRDAHLFGSSLASELSLRGSTRLDVFARLLGGWDDERPARLTWFEAGMGPAHRVHLSSTLDLDLAAFAAAALVRVAGGFDVDAIRGQRETWSARGGAALRLEPRLSRGVRWFLGVEGGALLRAVPVAFDARPEAGYRGGFVGLEFGVVLTPAP